MGKKLVLFLATIFVLFFALFQLVHKHGFKRSEIKSKIEKEELVKIPSKKVKKMPSAHNQKTKPKKRSN